MTILGIDWEFGKWKATTDGEAFFWYSTEEFLRGKPIADFPDLRTLLVESAHIAPRSKYSLAQVYTAEELEVFHKTYHNASVQILAFPEMLTPKARKEYGSKENDEDEMEKEDSALAIWRYHRDHPEVSLLRWGIKSSRTRELEGVLTDQRWEMNARLNVMRRVKYQDPQCIHALSILAAYSVSDNLLLWTKYKVGPRGGLSWRETFVMSLYVAIYLEDGTLRRDPTTGNPIGERWMWKMLKLHPYHRKAGVARSNLMHHCYRNMVGKFPDDKAAKRSFRLAIAEFRKVFQDAGMSVPAVDAGFQLPVLGYENGNADPGVSMM